MGKTDITKICNSLYSSVLVSAVFINKRFSFSFSFFFCATRSLETTPELNDSKAIHNTGRQINTLTKKKKKNQACVTDQPFKWVVKSLGVMEVSMQDRHVYCPFICSHAVWHTRKLLGAFFFSFFFVTLARKAAVTDMSRCLRCGVRADTSRFVSAAAWMTVFSVYPSFALFMPVWLRALPRACVFIAHVVPKNAGVWKPRRSEPDKQTMPRRRL